MIIIGAYDVFTDDIQRMVDRSCDEETVEKMQELIAAQKGVDHVDKLQTRIFGSRVYVDVEISADDHLTLVEAHAIAENSFRKLSTAWCILTPAAKRTIIFKPLIKQNKMPVRSSALYRHLQIKL